MGLDFLILYHCKIVPCW